MFPILEFSFTGLVPTRMYNVYVDVILADNSHWKFQNGQWIAVGEAEQLPKSRCTVWVLNKQLASESGKCTFILQLL